MFSCFWIILVWCDPGCVSESPHTGCSLFFDASWPTWFQYFWYSKKCFLNNCEPNFIKLIQLFCVWTGELHDRLAVLTQLKYDKFYSGSDNCVVVSPDQASARLWLGQYDNYREHLKDDHIESKKRRDKNGMLVFPFLVWLMSIYRIANNPMWNVISSHWSWGGSPSTSKHHTHRCRSLVQSCTLLIWSRCQNMGRESIEHAWNGSFGY